MPSYLPLPTIFQKSYNERDSYPRNLIRRTVSTYPSALAAYASRLDFAAPNLFETDVKKLEVPIRDLKTDNGNGQDLDKFNIQTPEELTRWFGVKIVQDPNDPENPVVAVQQKDPKCRFVYIHGANSRARLRITRSMLLELFTFHQVMPDYLDFISVFGLQSEARDLRFSSFREQKSLKLPHGASGVDSLGRSGRHYQLCYNLKGVNLKYQDLEDPGKSQWSIRQAAFYHQLDVVGGNVLWIVTKGGLDVQQRFKELTGTGARPEDKAFGTPEECFRSSLSAHLLFCHWSTEDWRGYIKWLEYTIEKDTEMAVLGPTGKGQHHHIYTARDIQHLQRWAEKVREVTSVLKANVDVMTSLRRFYTDLRSNEEFPMRKSCGDDISVFASQLGNLIDDFRLQIDRADALVRITTDRTELVKQHRLERLNLNMENEAIIVRIITIVTLIYLPATFVSTFFSTEVVSFDDDTPGGSFSNAAMMRWVQVTLPLTALTIACAYIGKSMAESRSQRQVLPMDTDDLHRSQWISEKWNWRPRVRKELSLQDIKV
ncbi:hypothetical protein V8E51_010681 [Hyaloscypha variabilis]